MYGEHKHAVWNQAHIAYKPTSSLSCSCFLYWWDVHCRCI